VTCKEHRGLLSIRYPMEHGIIRDWNDMERIWQYIFSKEQLQTFAEEVFLIFQFFNQIVAHNEWLRVAVSQSISNF